MIRIVLECEMMGTVLGYHGFNLAHLDDIVAHGLHTEKTRKWTPAVLASGLCVYFASTPKRALTLGGGGGLVVCEIDLADIIADEDEVPDVFEIALMAIAPTFGIEISLGEDSWGRWKNVCDYSDFASALHDRGEEVATALQAEVARVLELRSGIRSDAPLCREAVKGWIGFNRRLQCLGGPYSSHFDIPHSEPALIAWKLIEHEICAFHRTLGSRGKRGAPWSFRTLEPVTFDGRSHIRAILALREEFVWDLVVGKLPDATETALGKMKVSVGEIASTSLNGF